MDIINTLTWHGVLYDGFSTSVLKLTVQVHRRGMEGLANQSPLLPKRRRWRPRWIERACWTRRCWHWRLLSLLGEDRALLNSALSAHRHSFSAGTCQLIMRLTKTRSLVNFHCKIGLLPLLFLYPSMSPRPPGSTVESNTEATKEDIHLVSAAQKIHWRLKSRDGWWSNPNPHPS
jgi:hypothetical protein